MSFVIVMLLLLTVCWFSTRLHTEFDANHWLSQKTTTQDFEEPRLQEKVRRIPVHRLERFYHPELDDMESREERVQEK